MSPRQIVKARYTGPKSRGQAAAKLARYMEERKTERDGREVYEKATTFGDRGAFVEAANGRARQGRRSYYTHLVISPERGDEFTDEDFRRLLLLREVAGDRQGREGAYFAAVHRDGNRPHMHVAVARDKFGEDELARLKGRVHERIRERERVLDMRGGREAERGRGRAHGARDREDPRRSRTEEWERRAAGRRQREVDREERAEDAHYLYGLSRVRAGIEKRKGNVAWKRDHEERLREARGELGRRTGIPSFDEQRTYGRLFGGRMDWSGEARRGTGTFALHGRHGLSAARREVNRYLGRTPDVRQEPIGLWTLMTVDPEEVGRIARRRQEAAMREQERIYEMERRHEALEREYAARTRRVERARERVAAPEEGRGAERGLGDERER